MRKDYLPVTEAIERLDEAAFVEKYWSENWRDRERPPDVSAVTHRDEYRVIEPYLQRLPPGARLLDGGCGMGEWTLFFARRDFAITGIDISAENIGRLREWFPAHDFRRGDIRRTEFGDGTFDAYFSWGTFEHFEAGLADCIVEAHRILKRGGWLFISVPFHNGRLLRHDATRGKHEQTTTERQRFYQWRLTKAELQQELERRGFGVDSVTAIHKDTGVGRWLQWNVRLFAKGTLGYRVARRAFSYVLSPDYVSHMILAAAQRR